MTMRYRSESMRFHRVLVPMYFLWMLVCRHLTMLRSPPDNWFRVCWERRDWSVRDWSVLVGQAWRK